jgi:hypothetical protein
MPIDYSRWDSLTLSSDDEEESNNSRDQVRRVGTTQNFPIPDQQQSSPSSTASSSKKQTKVKIQIPCDNCHLFSLADTLKYCARCKLVPYCTKECQRKAWKMHKPNCIPHGDHDGHHRSLRALSNLFDLLMRHPDEKLFALGPAGPRLATPRLQQVIDLVSVAKNLYDQQGSGVLTIHFRDREECEDLAMAFSLAFQGNRSSFPPLPKLTYELWPFDRPVRSVLSLQAISIDALMENLGTDHFALCLTIPSTSDEGAGDGATQVMSIPYTTQGFGSVRKSSAPLTAAGSSQDFARRLEHDEAFQECRMMMKKYKCGPGVFWLRNIFSLNTGYERKEIKKLTPESLLRALQGQFEKLQALSADGGEDIQYRKCRLFSLFKKGTR